jgi:probable rRNA maturation factor
LPKSIIEVTDDQKGRYVRVSAKRIADLLAYVLKREKSKRLGLSVLVTDDRRIAKLHKDFMNDAAPTDVISFGLPKGSPEARAGHLGDVVVSAQTAKRVSADYDQTPAAELERYCVHGTLHLLGYDDHKPSDHKKMHAAQEKYLSDFSRLKRKR